MLPDIINNVNIFARKKKKVFKSIFIILIWLSLCLDYDAKIKIYQPCKLLQNVRSFVTHFCWQVKYFLKRVVIEDSTCHGSHLHKLCCEGDKTNTPEIRNKPQTFLLLILLKNRQLQNCFLFVHFYQHKV